MLMRDKVFFTLFILGLLIESGFAQSSAAEKTSWVSKADESAANLPHCVNSESDITEIQRVQKANSKTSSKYDGYRNILHASTALELATRLAYAETMAANCANQEEQVVGLVASVIGNRIRIRGGDINSVVFQKNQFSSSLNIYTESRYRDFLCPKDGELWNKALTKMRANLEESKPSVPIPKDAVNYYLYRHSDRFKAPNWKLDEVLIPAATTRECIRVFRDPGWI